MYAGADEFVARCAAFIREGLAAGEPALVMVTADKIGLLREELGPEAGAVEFADMGAIGRNPGRIISAWNDFAAEHLAGGRRLRGIGEPIWAGRSADELVECQHHESLLNVAFADAAGFRLLCPYDTAALPADVIAEAACSHPLILDGERLGRSGTYRGVDAVGVEDRPLPPPRGPAVEMGFQATTLPVVRTLVTQQAREAGLEPRRLADIVVAVSEVATNSLMHGGGQGVVRIWSDGDTFACEVRDRGRIDDPLVGRRRRDPSLPGGHGLWLAHQMCDLVQLRSRRGGTVVRLHMRLPSGA
jgi:anti-sigma regulatory factor (Ser/Thr protein kinase)